MIEVVESTEADNQAWADYVAAHPQSQLFHERRWSAAIGAAYGHETLHLAARREGQIVGVLPLTDVRSALFGRSLISGAFAVGGGALADDEAALDALCARAVELARARNARYIELRGGRAPKSGAWIEKTGIHAAFQRDLPASEAEIPPWLPKNRRAQIKKAMRLESEHGASLRLDGRAEEFHPLYAESLRNLGTPVPPVSLFAAIMDQFGDCAEISLCVASDGAPVAGLLTFWRRDVVAPYYIGATARARALSAFDYLYYQLMRRAIARGIKVFDYGRSKVGSTHFDTKIYWGFEPKPVVYHVALIGAKELPNLSGANPKFALVSNAWKRLPLPVANFAGPILARHLA